MTDKTPAQKRMENLVEQIEIELGRPENFAVIIVKVPTRETTMSVFIGNPATFSA